VQNGILPLLERKKVTVMLISEALEGKLVKSSKGQGIIQFADLRNDVYTREGVYAYACKVRPTYNPNVHKFVPADFYTTVYVAVDSE
jgi:hypothetical protein